MDKKKRKNKNVKVKGVPTAKPKTTLIPLHAHANALRGRRQKFLLTREKRMKRTIIAWPI